MGLRLKSSASRLFTQPFIQAEIKENIKAPRNGPLCLSEPVNSPNKWPVARKMFPFDDVIMNRAQVVWEMYLWLPYCYPPILVTSLRCIFNPIDKIYRYLILKWFTVGMYEFGSSSNDHRGSVSLDIHFAVSFRASNVVTEAYFVRKISYHTYMKVWDIIIHQCPNSNGV